MLAHANFISALVYLNWSILMICNFINLIGSFVWYHPCNISSFGCQSSESNPTREHIGSYSFLSFFLVSSQSFEIFNSQFLSSRVMGCLHLQVCARFFLLEHRFISFFSYRLPTSSQVNLSRCLRGHVSQFPVE